MLRLREEFETAVAVRKAQSLMEAGDGKQAAEVAKELLDRDPSNADAVEILASIRRSRAPRAVAPEPPPAATRSHRVPREGVLNVTSNPPGMVYLDDDLIGRAPVKGRNLAPGNYTLQVRAPGHRPYETSIKVSPGRELALVVPLVSDSPAANGNGFDEKDKEPSGRPPAPAFPPRPSPFETSAPPPSASPPAPAPVAAVSRTAPPRSIEPKGDSVVSARPKEHVPVPRLPRTQEARDAEDLARLLTQIEKETVALAGVTPEFAVGVTGPLRRALEARRQMVTYPVGVYYFIVAEAARGHDKRTTAQNLVTSHQNEGIRKLSALPTEGQISRQQTPRGSGGRSEQEAHEETSTRRSTRRSPVALANGRRFR